MNIKDFIENLDITDLKFAEKEIRKKIIAFENERKSVLFFVEDVNGEQYFSIDFNDAKKKLCEFIMDEDFSESLIHNFSPLIQKLLVHPSEVERYLNLNNL